MQPAKVRLDESFYQVWLKDRLGHGRPHPQSRDVMPAPLSSSIKSRLPFPRRAKLISRLAHRNRCTSDQMALP